MTCPHTSVFFDSAGAGICLDCHTEISRTKAFDGEKTEPAAPKPAPKQTTVAPTEVQLLRALADIQSQWINLLASSLETMQDQQRFERECDETAPAFFLHTLRNELKLTALHRHVGELAADAMFLRQSLKESFPNGK